MTVSCKGLNNRFQSKSFGNVSKYTDYYKRCSYGGVFMNITSLRYTLKLHTKSDVNTKQRGIQNA